jgi:hypothetical protein
MKIKYLVKKGGYTIFESFDASKAIQWAIDKQDDKVEQVIVNE